MYTNIVLFIILLALSAFSSASEVALVGLNRAKVKALAESGKVAGRRIEKLKENPDHFMISILLLNNVVNTGTAALATAIALDIFGDAGVAIATGIVTILILVFGEVGPKTYANRHHEKIALLVATPIYWLTMILTPFFWVYDKIRGVVNKGEDTPAVTEEEIREWIDVGEMEGAIEEDEKEMIYSVLRFNDTTAKEIMTPRPDVSMIEDSATLEEAVAYIRDTGYSRLPVYHETVDNIVGSINFKDVFDAYTSDDHTKLTVKNLMVEVYCVPESKKIDDLLRDLQVRRVHLAIVLDEFGGFSGVVTIEDILEELVGDIMDETDVDEVEDIIEIADGMYMLDAQVRVAQLNEYFEIELPEDPGSYETIGGLIFSHLGHIPRLGEAVKTVDDITLVVTKMRGRQILKVKMIFPLFDEEGEEE